MGVGQGVTHSNPNSICFLKLEEVKADFFHQDRDKIGRVPRTSVLLPCLVVD